MNKEIPAQFLAFHLSESAAPLTKKTTLAKGYGVFSVVIVTPNTKRKFKYTTFEFMGIPPIFSTAFVISGSCKITANDKYKKMTIKAANPKQDWKCVKRTPNLITLDDVNYMITELHTINPPELRVQMLDVLGSKNQCTPAEFKAIPAYAALQMQYHCEYFRADLELPLRVAFGGKAIRKILPKIEPYQLEKLYKHLTTKPWELCFAKWLEPYSGLKEITLERIKDYLSQHPWNPDGKGKRQIPQYFMTAIRLYDWIKKQRKNYGREIFRLDTLFKEYCSSSKFQYQHAVEVGDDRFAEVACDYLRYQAMEVVDVGAPRQHQQQEEGDRVGEVQIGAERQSGQQEEGDRVGEGVVILGAKRQGSPQGSPQGSLQSPKLYGIIKDVKDNKRLIKCLEKLVVRGIHFSVSPRTGPHTPCLSSGTLTETQKRTVKHVFKNPFTFLEGGPGTGKTEVLVKILEEFSAPLVVTRVGMMVNALQERFGKRVETACTIHSVVYTHRYNKLAREKLFPEFDIAVIDEGSNVDTELLADFLECLPNVVRLLICGDLGQIYPIEVGAPFQDLTRRYREHTFALTENKRVNPNARILAESCALLRAERYKEIEFNTTEALLFWRRAFPHDCEAHLSRALFAEFGVRTPEDTMEMQILVLTNADRQYWNNLTEKLLLERGVLRKKRTETVWVGTTEMYPGKKIQFTKNTKQEPDGQYSSVKNGELGQIRTVTSSAEGYVIYLTNGKTVLCNGSGEDTVVDPKTICAGYASTCNKAQGSEWKNILFHIYDNPYEGFTREYPYVALSRAKNRCIVMGESEDVFYKVCKKAAPTRDTILNQYLMSEAYDLPMVEFDTVQLKDPATLQLLSPDESAVPVLPPASQTSEATILGSKKQRNNNISCTKGRHFE
jgi:hypothetical protein